MYVHGNHEAYGQNLDDVQTEIADACRKTDHVHFLNQSEFIIEDVRFLGASMWTDFCLFGPEERQASMREAEAVMTDYKRIRLANSGYRKLRAADTAKMHATQKSWLKSKLAEPFTGKTVVVTHTAPSIRSIPDRYPVLHSLAKTYTTASKLDGRACQMIYRNTDWSLIDYSTLSNQERSLILTLGIVLNY